MKKARGKSKNYLILIENFTPHVVVSTKICDKFGLLVQYVGMCFIRKHG